MVDPRPAPATLARATALLLVLCCLYIPGQAQAGTTTTITDSSGQKVEVTQGFTRIISLYSAHTENLCSLGAESTLVGIGAGDDYPPSVLDRPAFSYREDPEKFIALRPDLVLVRPMIERSYPEFINKLRQAKVTVVSLQPNSREEIFDYWRTLGILTGHEKQAEEMITAFTARLAGVRERLKNIPAEARPRVYFQAIHNKMKTFARDSIAVYVLEQAGGINLAADAEQVRETNIAAYGKERLLSRGGEIDIFLAQQGKMNPVTKRIIAEEPGFQGIKAVREGKILLIAEALVSRPTLRILDGIEQLHQAFFPPPSTAGGYAMTACTAPACIISGTSSGSGKTTVALGLMAAFRARGMQVAPFKCGPDFIDPGLHQLITGTVSRNLDLWMCGEPFTRTTFQDNSQGADIAIIEGVMGMFDGGLSSSGSLAATLGLPGILVLDVRSMAESAAAIVKGFETFIPAAAPKGIILNRVASDRHLQLVGDAIAANCRAEVLGYLPRSLEFAIPSRHLGLVTGDEAPLSPEAIHSLAESVARHINLDRIISLCGRLPATPAVAEALPQTQLAPLCRIGVARDKAFCFYYQDNFDLLRRAGAELVFFSPTADRELPAGLDGLYLGGGYPELYAEQLSANTPMRTAIREWIEGDGPVYAECGGFMYLTEGIADRQGAYHPMVGAFPVKATMQEKRASLGYREVRTTAPCCFGPAGTILRGHEFHYSHIEPMPDRIARIYAVNNTTREGYTHRRVLGGYMHLHFGFAPRVVTEFINFCRE